MSPLPTELITLFASSTLSSIFRLLNFNQKARRDERIATLLALRSEKPSLNIQRLQASPSSSLQWTRRVIAFIAVFSIILLPKLVSIYKPEVAIHIGYAQPSPGFLWFNSDVERITWAHLKGLVITPLDTHLLSAIIGLYFGGSLISQQY